MQEQAVSCLRTAVREAYRGLVTNWMEFAHEKGVDQKLWGNWYREIESLQRKMKEAKDLEQNQRRSTSEATNALGLTVSFSVSEGSRLKDRLKAVISEAVTFYSRLVQA